MQAVTDIVLEQLASSEAVNSAAGRQADLQRADRPGFRMGIHQDPGPPQVRGPQGEVRPAHHGEERQGHGFQPVQDRAQEGAPGEGQQGLRAPHPLRTPPRQDQGRPGHAT